MNVEQMAILELKAKLYDLIHASQDVVSEFATNDAIASVGIQTAGCIERLKSTLAQVEA